MTRGEIRGVAIAVVAAASSVALLLVLPVTAGVGVIALIAIVAYAAYPALALKRAERRTLVAEGATFLLGVLFVIMGIVAHPAWLAVAFGIHSFIDVAHERPRERLVAHTPRWYTRFCLVYDWLVAGIIPFGLK